MKLRFWSSVPFSEGFGQLSHSEHTQSDFPSQDTVEHTPPSACPGIRGARYRIPSIEVFSLQNRSNDEFQGDYLDDSNSTNDAL